VSVGNISLYFQTFTSYIYKHLRQKGYLSIFTRKKMSLKLFISECVSRKYQFTFPNIYVINGLYAQLHYFLNFSQLLVSCLPLLAKLINSGVSDYCCHDYWGQAHLNQFDQ